MEQQQTRQMISEPAIPPGRLFLSVPEASVILGLDRECRTVRKAIEAGEIPATRVGQAVEDPRRVDTAAGPAGW